VSADGIGNDMEKVTMMGLVGWVKESEKVLSF
jgi:hypothetical protein